MNDSELLDFVQLTENQNLDVRFIEYMPFSGNGWNKTLMVTYKDMVQQIQSVYKGFHPLVNGFNDTSKVSFIFCLVNIPLKAVVGLESSRLSGPNRFYNIDERTFLRILQSFTFNR